MRDGLKKGACGVASALILTLLSVVWAAPSFGGAAQLVSPGRSGVAGEYGSAGVIQGPAVPAPARFRESGGRGLLVQTWVNGAGPFTFALDTGAGATILSRRVAAEARVEVEAGGRGIEVGGLSGRTVSGGQRAFPRSLAIGSRENLLPSRGFVIVSEGLPTDLDGVLDPSECYGRVGFVLDMPRGEIRAFDPLLTPLRAGDHPPGGATVAWLTDGGSKRPFVMLAQGRRALLDTGSAYGLAFDESAARALGIPLDGGGPRGARRDIAGGRVTSRRVRPATVSVGPLVLRRVPTDLLLRAERNAPVILGRDALRPFEVVFDPVNHLIMLKPPVE